MAVNTDAVTVGGSDISRREFLNYAWLASIGVMTVEWAVVTYFFSFPRMGPGEFGGPVAIGAWDVLPGLKADPEPFNRSKFWWIVDDEDGNGPLVARAIYKICTHLGCIYGWKPDQVKFICPCHGSQFSRIGNYLAGPAPRDLDRFLVRAVDSTGNQLATTDDMGLLDLSKLAKGTNLIVETGTRIKGQPKAG